MDIDSIYSKLNDIDKHVIELKGNINTRFERVTQQQESILARIDDLEEAQQRNSTWQKTTEGQLSKLEERSVNTSKILWVIVSVGTSLFLALVSVLVLKK